MRMDNKEGGVNKWPCPFPGGTFNENCPYQPSFDISVNMSERAYELENTEGGRNTFF